MKITYREYSQPTFSRVLACSVLVSLLLFEVFASLKLNADDLAVAAPTTSPFFLQDSPRPVLFIGDDATAQRMFTTLIETYTLSRFPAWKITFRNTGWEGDKILGVGMRGYSRDEDIRRDIESFRPQAAIINYGMNDARGGEATYESFLTNVNILSRDLPRVGVYHAAFVTANPEEGFETDAPGGSNYNLMLEKYAEGMKERFPIGWKDGVESVQRHPKGPVLPQLQDAIFIDLLNPMIDFIAQGRKAGVLSPDSSLGDKSVRLVPDGVHPNWSGHFIMAALVLQGLRAPDLVSSATLDAGSHSTISTEGCSITWQDAAPGVVQFERTDGALPWPTPPDVDMALKIPGFDPATTLNRYELKLIGLKEASYQLSIDDQVVGVYSQVDLAHGVNLGGLRRGPIYDQGQKLIKAVEDKNDTFFNRWRNVEIGPPPAPGTSAADIRKAEAAHLAEVKPELARLDQVLGDEEQAIHLLCQPLPHIFKLQPVAP